MLGTGGWASLDDDLCSASRLDRALLDKCISGIWTAKHVLVGRVTNRVSAIRATCDVLVIAGYCTILFHKRNPRQGHIQ